jgi:DNA invertase Pin-like site-specific DNA recombinase
MASAPCLLKTRAASPEPRSAGAWPIGADPARVRVLTTAGDELTDTSDPSRVLMRQIAGSFAEYEKARLVAKRRGARARVRAEAGKCEGRKSYAELVPDVVAQARRLRRKLPKGGRMSLRAIAQEVATRGHFNSAGRPYSASSIQSMLNSKAEG